MTLGQFTEPRLLIPRLLSDRQDGAIQELAKRLEATGRIQNASAFLEAVLKRENELPNVCRRGRGGAARARQRGEQIVRSRRTVRDGHPVGF